MIDLRLRTRISDDELAEKQGKIVTEDDANLLLTGPALVRKPDGQPLCVYLPGHLRSFAQDTQVYDVLHSLRKHRTDNRGEASGTQRVRIGEQKRTRTALIASAVVGSIDPGGNYRYCRLTAWTGENLPGYTQLHPLLQAMGQAMAQHVPTRHQAQLQHVQATHPAWVIPDTPFTTVTVNNTYPTGVHTDKGDLAAGFSTLACIRRGTFTGGHLTFPRYRVAVNMQDGDLLLMDAHEHHGNTAIRCSCLDQGQRRTLNGPCTSCNAERISVVAYYREKMTSCGTPEQEAARAHARREAQQA